jgi:hypothetical protein
VWKRQANGTWRVWLDEGIRLPNIWKDAAPFRVAPEPDAGTEGTPNERIDDVERGFMFDARPALEVFRRRLAADARLHRDGEMPIVGRDAILARFPKQGTQPPCKPLRTETAASGDLAVVVAGCDEAGKKPMSVVRVWKRDVTGRWRIVFQTENPH